MARPNPRQELPLARSRSSAADPLDAPIWIMSHHKDRELDPPPIADENPESREFLRIWAPPGAGPQMTLLPTWKDPAAWGLLLVDIARHAALAYAREGQDPDAVLQRIWEYCDAERSAPTDDPEDFTDGH